MRSAMMPGSRAAAALTLAMLAGCSKSKLDADIDATVATTKTCGDYAQMRAITNCVRFVEEGRSKDAPVVGTMDRTIKALDRHWRGQCDSQQDDATRLELMTTVTLQRNGIGPGKSIPICAAEVDRELASYPRLAKDVTR